jgi:hypothetical protein
LLKVFGIAGPVVPAMFDIIVLSATLPPAGPASTYAFVAASVGLTGTGNPLMAPPVMATAPEA